MKCPLNLVKYIASACILLHTPLLAYASSSCKEEHSCKESTHCERGKQGKQGKEGKQGKQGDPGRGERGKRGHKGDKGDPGIGQQGEQGEQGEQGDPGRDGINGTSFVSTFGTWSIIAPTQPPAPIGAVGPILVPKGDVVPFEDTGSAISGITNTNGTFTLPNDGVYLCTFSIQAFTVQGNTAFFNLRKNPGNIILKETVGDSSSNAANTGTITFAALAGDEVEVYYAGSNDPSNTADASIGLGAFLGPNFDVQDVAYFQLVQIQ